ncbi:hypothetical protein YDYSY3_38820 [Paenibacillus chitinolyticus]|uniref:hypothetical protein n=1 Tax=Paenibacillus chitinolyticus TaxID=79263 RepID=UPI0026E49B9A|nr:hypothetical protein [Paenibacillus chitinolyticus]GKS12882.1 hypothetical protein YDYSY3_38820 [Paenibacillus chitinolyticus]
MLLAREQRGIGPNPAAQFVLNSLPLGLLPLSEYDEVHVCTSGGVDSVATALVALHGYSIPKEKIKLVHMRVDGDPHDKTKRQLFDWPQTDEYLRQAFPGRLGVLETHGE